MARAAAECAQAAVERGACVASYRLERRSRAHGRGGSFSRRNFLDFAAASKSGTVCHLLSAPLRQALVLRNRLVCCSSFAHAHFEQRSARTPPLLR